MRDLSQRFQATFADQLRRALAASDLRQIDLATALQVQESQVSRWRKGELLPSQAHLPGIERELRLSDDAAEDLHAAWMREARHLPIRLAPPSERLERLIADLESASKMVETLRLSGQPRIAMQLAIRERDHVLLRAGRSNMSSATRTHIFRKASELVLEQCKSALDFMSRADVKAGALAGEMSLLQGFADECRDTETRFASVLTVEAATYVGGDVASSLRQTRELLQQANRIPDRWLAEVLRAAAINAGKADDVEAMNDVNQRIDRYLDLGEVEVSPTQAGFLLEGLARGLSQIDAGRADAVVQRAWTLSGADGGHGGGSALRYVQLTRTEAEISIEGCRPSLELGQRLRSALEISRRQGYDRYVDQLAILEQRVCGGVARP